MKNFIMQATYYSDQRVNISDFVLKDIQVLQTNVEYEFVGAQYSEVPAITYRVNEEN